MYSQRHQNLKEIGRLNAYRKKLKEKKELQIIKKAMNKK